MTQCQDNFSLSHVLATPKSTTNARQWFVTPVRNDETVDLSRMGSVGSLDTPKFAPGIDTPSRDSRPFVSPVFSPNFKEEEEEDDDDDDDATIDEDDCIQFSMIAEEDPMKSHPTPKMNGGTQARSPLVDVLNNINHRSNNGSQTQKPFISSLKQFDPLAEASFSDWSCTWTPYFGPKKTPARLNPDDRKSELSMSLFDLPNEEMKPEDIPKYSQKEWDAMKEIHDKTSREFLTLRTQHAEMEEQLQRELNEKNRMKAILDEFETMIRTMVKKIETHDAEKNDLEAELDHAALQNHTLLQEKNQLQGDLQTLEESFEQLHMKYEELKSINEAYATNEETLRRNIEGLKNDVVIANDRYEKLKNHAKDKMDSANTEITKVRTEHQKEIMKFRAQLKSNEIRINTLESQIEAKEAENKQLVSFSEQILIEMEKLK